MSSSMSSLRRMMHKKAARTLKPGNWNEDLGWWESAMRASQGSSESKKIPAARPLPVGSSAAGRPWSAPAARHERGLARSAARPGCPRAARLGLHIRPAARSGCLLAARSRPAAHEQQQQSANGYGMHRSCHEDWTKEMRCFTSPCWVTVAPPRLPARCSVNI